MGAGRVPGQTLRHSSCPGLPLPSGAADTLQTGATQGASCCPLPNTLHGAWSMSDHKYPFGFKLGIPESAPCPAVTLLNFSSHSPNTRLSFFPRSWLIHLFSHLFCTLDFLHLSLLNSLSSWLFPSPCSFFIFLFPFLLLSSNAAVFPPSLPSFSFLSFHSYPIHFLPHPILSRRYPIFSFQINQHSPCFLCILLSAFPCFLSLPLSRRILASPVPSWSPGPTSSPHSSRGQ